MYVKFYQLLSSSTVTFFYNFSITYKIIDNYVMFLSYHLIVL